MSRTARSLARRWRDTRRRAACTTRCAQPGRSCLRTRGRGLARAPAAGSTRYLSLWSCSPPAQHECWLALSTARKRAAHLEDDGVHFHHGGVAAGGAVPLHVHNVLVLHLHASPPTWDSGLLRAQRNGAGTHLFIHGHEPHSLELQCGVVQECHGLPLELLVAVIPAHHTCASAG